MAEVQFTQLNNLPTTLQDRTFHHYYLDENDKVVARVSITGDVNGSFSPTGLSVDFRITTMDVSSVAIPLPAVSLAARNAVSITNLDQAETLYIGKSNVTPDAVNGTTSGWEVGPNESFNIDVTDAITLYGRCQTGVTVKIKIFEVA